MCLNKIKHVIYVYIVFFNNKQIFQHGPQLSINQYILNSPKKKRSLGYNLLTSSRASLGAFKNTRKRHIDLYPAS
jgi:hypothetical protein